MTIGSHQATVGKSQVHITPRWILDALGRFDLDPCAADPRPWDCAKRSYTERDDGLSRPWTGRVFLNPPFCRYGVDRWMMRMAEHNHGIALLHVRPETTWFTPCWQHASGMLFLRRRVIFHKPDGSPQTISNPNSKHWTLAQQERVTEMTRDEYKHELARDLSTRMIAVMKVNEPSFEVTVQAIANIIGMMFAVDSDLTEADLVEAMNDLRDGAVTIFRDCRENDMRDGELIRHDN
jgi:DNA N-6-adenine-methyltransferase (Dam)